MFIFVLVSMFLFCFINSSNRDYEEHEFIDYRVLNAG